MRTPTVGWPEEAATGNQDPRGIRAIQRLPGLHRSVAYKLNISLPKPEQDGSISGHGGLAPVCCPRGHQLSAPSLQPPRTCQGRAGGRRCTPPRLPAHQPQPFWAPFSLPPPRHVSVPPRSCPEPHHARWHHAVSPPVLTLPSAFPCELCARAARRRRRRSGLLFQQFHSLGSRPFGWVTPHPPRTRLAMALLRLTWTVRSLSAGAQ